jgi:hypothetical protein
MWQHGKDTHGERQCDKQKEREREREREKEREKTAHHIPAFIRSSTRA